MNLLRKGNSPPRAESYVLASESIFKEVKMAVAPEGEETLCEQLQVNSSTY